jgi:hypothetical protein
MLMECRARWHSSPRVAKVFQKLFGGLLGMVAPKTPRWEVDGPRGRKIKEESNSQSRLE